ncbi:PREDICTED: 40S ribosomal protein S27-1-like isoform X2 [Nicotiana attenuata]|uniref:40S ribosomal protein S27-1-like isoform X2 n=1 Tax=Nicotiana attenuata TaxID=49451 RepID=UPI000905B8B3|nr:PREDICTED: 40S ribosomal protein S27-1-like isoform X2 [Nicotiana attenuata]
MVLPNDIDLLNPPAKLGTKTHKLKSVLQGPTCSVSVKCQCCFIMATNFGRAQSFVLCSTCQQETCTPSSTRSKLTEGCSFRVKKNAKMIFCLIFCYSWLSYQGDVYRCT